MNDEDFAARLRAGELRAVARLLTLIENGDAAAETALRTTWERTGGAYVVGITGPPGAGKSTLVDALAALAVERGHRVGVLAVDPTSPYSGGAVLGDRLRMSRAQEQGVFIRSVATRGHLGGLTATTRYLVSGLELLGLDLVLVETVGAGQGDVEVVSLADTTLVVSVPGLGDEVQMQKAGILEIGDVLVVNKGDRPGVERLVAELTMMLELAETRPDWQPPLITTTATTGDGVPELWDALTAHRAHLGEAGLRARRLAQQREELLSQLRQRLFRAKVVQIGDAPLTAAAERVVAREREPFSAVAALVGG